MREGDPILGTARAQDRYFFFSLSIGQKVQEEPLRIGREAEEQWDRTRLAPSARCNCSQRTAHGLYLELEKYAATLSAWAAACCCLSCIENPHAANHSCFLQLSLPMQEDLSIAELLEKHWADTYS